MPKRKFRERWSEERIEREKAWRKARQKDKRKAKDQIRKGLDDYNNR